MGEMTSKLVGPFKNFNVKNRAFRLISSEKPKRAPYHPTTVKYLEKMLIEASPPVQRIHLQRLKRIYVTSKDPTKMRVANFEKAKAFQLPHNRKPVSDLAFGYLEPHHLETGKVSLRQALSFIGRHHSDPKKWKISVISQQYQLRYNVTMNILDHFTPFKTFMLGNEKEEWHANTRKLRKMVAGKPKVLALKNE